MTDRSNEPHRADDFKGDDANLIRCIDALLDFDDDKALVPHGLGGKGSHAYRLLCAARHRLDQAKVAREHQADVMIGEFVARWEEAADGVVMDADTAEALAREFKRLRGLVYCPGTLRCAKCDFRLVKTTLNVSDGNAYANNEPDQCPNCDVPMWRVTWEGEARDAYKVAESQMDRALAAEASLAASTNSLREARLEDALRPFAQLGDRKIVYHISPDDPIILRARAALAQPSRGEG
jgi:hypothetical protein